MTEKKISLSTKVDDIINNSLNIYFSKWLILIIPILTLWFISWLINIFAIKLFFMIMILPFIILYIQNIIEGKKTKIKEIIIKSSKKILWIFAIIIIKNIIEILSILILIAIYFLPIIWLFPKTILWIAIIILTTIIITRIWFSFFIYISKNKSVTKSISESNKIVKKIWTFKIRWKFSAIIVVYFLFSLIVWSLFGMISIPFGWSLGNVITQIISFFLYWYIMTSITVLYFSYDNLLKNKKADTKVWCLFYWWTVIWIIGIISIIAIINLILAGTNFIQKNLLTTKNINIPVFSWTINSSELTEINKKTSNIIKYWEKWNVKIPINMINYLIKNSKNDYIKDHIYLENKDNILHILFNYRIINNKYINWNLWFLIKTIKDSPNPIFLEFKTWYINNKWISNEIMSWFEDINLLTNVYREKNTNQNYNRINNISKLILSWEYIILEN